MPRTFTLCLVVTVALAVLVGCGVKAPDTPARSAHLGPKPTLDSHVKLAVLVVFDQMRGDYLQKWQPLFRPDGFVRLQNEGAWFTKCYYPYATTTTGPGHASMLTGTCPDRHGIINNNWHDPNASSDDNEEGTGVYCAGSTRYDLVPKNSGSGKVKLAGNPDRLLSETLADVLKRESNGHSKVFGLSLKDRSAILPIGKKPDGAYWFTGHFVTSTYYSDRVHPWVANFNASGQANQWFGQSWDRFRSDIDYEKQSGPDSMPGEGKGANQGVMFPHPFSAGLEKVDKKYYDALANSPAGNDLLLAFAKTCIKEEKLGQRDVSDLLVVSFSSNDLIGHCWGPDSQEVLDVTLRSDALMADFLKFLDETVGVGKYAMAVTADHGVCPIPEVAATKGLDAKHILPAAAFGALKHLQDTFGGAADTRWLDAVSPPWFYLNRRAVAASGKSLEEVSRSLADYLATQSGVARTFTREQLNAVNSESEEMARIVKRSYHPDRSGDVYMLLKPYYLLGGPTSTGTTHGSPYEYDRHVPLLAFGPGVAGGTKAEAVTPQAAAAILAQFLGVKPPKEAEFPVPMSLNAK